MAVKAMFAFCTLALLIQTALSQCCGGCGCGFGPAASTGGTFVVTSYSPVAPTGITVLSDNFYEGALIIKGNLPLLGSVALEGTMGTAGAGAVSYGCGDGAVGIVTEEGPVITSIASEANFGCLVQGLGYGLGNGLGNGLYGIGSFDYFENGLYGNGLYGNGLYGNCQYGLDYGYGNGLYGFDGFGGLSRYGGFDCGCGCGYGLGAYC